MLAEAGRRLGHVPGEVDAGHGDALEVRGQRGQPAVEHRGDAELREVAERRLEAGRRDDVVRLEDERLGPGRVERVHAVGVLEPLDPLDRGVEDVASRRAAHVLVVRRQVPGTERGTGEAAEVGRPRRDEGQLADALPDDALADLERGVALPDDDHAAVAIPVGTVSTLT